MSNVTGIFISAKQLSKGVVRRFCDALEKRVAVKESLPDDGESFESDGVALMVGAEVHGLLSIRDMPAFRLTEPYIIPTGAC
jgi:hypothetical protein